MKKYFFAVFAFVMALSMCCVAFAAEPSEDMELKVIQLTDADLAGIENGISPLADLTISFSNMSYRESRYSSETYYIEDEDALLTISSATWNPASQDIWIGWRNIDTNTLYYATYSGGDITNRAINAYGVPDGDYQVFISNRGSRAITGAMQYHVD